ncbi:MAG: GNAT family N-acetyltransferase [Actinobacteria bacterium]|nr:GNAT family N-acetyltransferase [Actinomycetota bacterium]
MASSETIEIEDPRTPDVLALLARHLEFCNTHSPPEDVHALDVEGLLDPAVTFFALRRDGALAGVGALKELDARHAEIKSMHTAEAARGTGVGSALVAHLLATARARGYARVSLETGSMDAFAPARSLYAKAGFETCGPFGDYRASPNSDFMTLELA